MACVEVPDNITLLAAPHLFGHLFNYGLFGVLSTQVFIYHVSFPNDRLRLKVFVYGLYAMEVLQLVMATHDAFETLGRGWGNTTTLDNPQWLWFDVPLISGIVSASVQIYFAWRIYVLSRSKILSGFIVLIALAQGSAGIASGIKAHLVNSLADLQAETTKSLIVWLGGSVACDIVIALCMLYYLSRGRRGLASDALLARLIRLTVETGTLTASVACLDLVFFLVFKHNNLHLTPALILTKIYTNSLMMLLNNRTQMRSMIGGQVWMTEETGDVELASRSRTSRRRSAVPQQVALRKFPSQERDSVSDPSSLKAETAQESKVTGT
ncbi:hypothetical protein C8Q80DRAFT_1270777 [Daedaleopsis nitida]|nr:hypothetical protein C8Q80DRAFT_1270777 [Daedaleopsis nitida]